MPSTDSTEAPPAFNASTKLSSPASTSGSAGASQSPRTTPTRGARDTTGETMLGRRFRPTQGKSPKLRCSQPKVSNAWASGKLPEAFSLPKVARYDTSPHSAAGARRDPPVSVPKPIAAAPMSTLAAAPELEPPVNRSGYPGCVTSPKQRFSPVMP